MKNGKVKIRRIYTKQEVRFILDNYIKNEDKCVEVTGHSLHSIKAMLKNIAFDYGFEKYGLANGNSMYTEVANEYRKENKVFGETMSKKSFVFRFGIIK